MYAGTDALNFLFYILECNREEAVRQRRKPTETLDWYGVLQVEATADDTTLKYQHDKLCLVAFILMKTLFLVLNLLSTWFQKLI
uniref:Uncharacterized protein n=1 Tax=Oryza nivara TaxID=4536 RepID=A0A0E0J3I9_ORYNI